MKLLNEESARKLCRQRHKTILSAPAQPSHRPPWRRGWAAAPCDKCYKQILIMIVLMRHGEQHQRYSNVKDNVIRQVWDCLHQPPVPPLHMRAPGWRNVSRTPWWHDRKPRNYGTWSRDTWDASRRGWFHFTGKSNWSLLTSASLGRSERESPRERNKWQLQSKDRWGNHE